MTATAPELAGHSGSYLADCQLGVVGGDIFSTGVRPHAHDADTARALWDLSERLVAAAAG